MNSKEKFINEIINLKPHGSADYNKAFNDCKAAVSSLVETSDCGPSEMVYPSDLQMLNQKAIEQLKETIKEQEATIAKLQHKKKHPICVVEGNYGRSPIRDSLDAYAYMMEGMKPNFKFGIDPAKKKEKAMKTEHEIKCDPKYFTRLCDGTKTFEIRYNDRDYQVGDRLIIKEFDPEKGWPDHGSYGTVIAEITYLTDYFQKDGWVVLGLKIIEIDA